MRGNDVRLDLHTKTEEPIVHLLEPREIVWQSTEAVAEETLDVTFAVEFVVASTVTMRQTNPIQSIAFGEKGVILWRKEAGYPVQGTSLHPFDGFIERIFDTAIQNPGIDECCIDTCMSQQFLKG